MKDDRPSWSPDGTRIAYESEATDGSGQMDILVTDISTSITGPTLNLTQTPGFTEGKPVWSPDGKWIYYSRRANASQDDDILRIRSDGSGIPGFIVNSAIAEYQVALSPDGKQLCYTRGAFGSANADVYVRAVSGFGEGIDLSDTDEGAYNCAWSPDGKQVAYVVGIFTAGRLVVEPITDTGATLLVPDVASHFDGNPDWAPVHPARCEGKPATIAGTDGPDVIKGTSGRDVIAAHGGKDKVSSLGGRDLVCGGKGADNLKGGGGNDRLNGGKGIDTCDGGPGADIKVSCEH